MEEEEVRKRKQETGQEQKRGEETKGKKVAVFPDDVTEGKKSSRALEKEKVFQFENDGVEKIRANFCKFLRLTRKNADRSGFTCFVDFDANRTTKKLPNRSEFQPPPAIKLKTNATVGGGVGASAPVMPFLLGVGRGGSCPCCPVTRNCK
ncbi:hypothetical protein RUM44_002252 [Polyplax serrata]|uniref:Uncharacterized protein n=1 Tax=Polyplax serrata TaxID=468196 RepID=A0ABR1AMA8_POLSC